MNCHSQLGRVHFYAIMFGDKTKRKRSVISWKHPAYPNPNNQKKHRNITFLLTPKESFQR